ncbi:DNA-J related domain-containing protein [Halorhodospira halochloris]|uniref:DNA-J related domain-containing protein n=1 Tax=Halorhodospira halochloris TaxID=1052 RepID=UPI00076F861C|nr:DNA-J related domain-containing protein [Halorhodospira halochloris]MBK1650651.1 hypothetical protein [Halorhodospira halochloris]
MELEDAVTQLQITAVQILRTKYPGGVDEMTLMDELDAAGLELFAKQWRHQPERLFRAHFILFHALYRLRPDLAAQGLDIAIHCLEIRLYERDGCNSSHAALTQPDELAAYYLDQSNLEGMDDTAVEELINDGLRRCLGDISTDRGTGNRCAALATLGLDNDADKNQIRRTYRRLAMRYHPDRGGDTATLQQINAAYRTLMAGEP